MKTLLIIKQSAILLFFSLLSFTVSAGGPYDGVWELIVPGISGLYGSLHQSGDTLVLIGLDDNDEDGAWHAYAGLMQGSEAELSTVISGHNTSIVYHAEFTSLTTGILTSLSCSPVSICETMELPNNVSFEFVKIF